MADQIKCPECGAEMPPGDPAGLCVACVLRKALPAKAAAEPENADQSTIHLSFPLTEKPGDKIGNYKLHEQIGEGGCGVVYSAEQKEPIRRKVALKVIKLGMDTKQVVARFEAERQALALMDHPNIAKVLDAGATETGRPFFVMELVRGIKITDYCDKHQLSTEERLKLFVQVCHAIQHAHQKGIIHRDIKPSNILVTLHDGVPVPKVIDFGIAKATTGQPLSDKTIFTAFEQFIGTPAYMSPEQAEMSGLDIDTRTDVYALGVLLYELLTGKTPFDAKELFAKGLDEVRRIIREEEPPRPSTRLSTLDAGEQTTLSKLRQSEPPKLLGIIRGDLDWIVMKTLEKDRTRRYETANGLAMEIERYLKSELVLARPPSRLYRFQKMVRRNKFAFTAASAVATAILLGLGLSTWLFLKEKQARSDAESARQNEAKQRLEAEAAKNNAQSEAKRAEDAAMQANLTLSMSDFLQGVRRAEEGNGNDALAYLAGSLAANPTNSSTLTLLSTLLTYHRWRFVTLAFEDVSMLPNSDGTRVLTTTRTPSQTNRVGSMMIGLPFIPTNQVVRLWDTKTAKPVDGPLSSRLVRSAQFSPDGKRILTTSTNYAQLWDAQSGQTISDPMQHESTILGARFSPDGKRIVTTSRTGKTACLWDGETGRPVAQALKHDAYIGPVLSRDGKRILTVSTNEVRVWDIHTGHPLTDILTNEGRVMSAEFSPDSKLVAVASAQYSSRTNNPLSVSIPTNNTVRVWNTETGKLLISSLPVGVGTKMTFSPDGRRLVTEISYTARTRVWNAQTGELLMPSSTNERLMSVRFSPDGKRVVTTSSSAPLVFMNGEARMWDVESDQPLVKTLYHKNILSPQFSPDGERLVTFGEDSTALIWNAPTGELATPPLRHGGPVTAAHFTEDGMRMLTTSADKTTREWDTRTGQMLSEPLKHGAPVSNARVSTDGRLVFTESVDFDARVWSPPTARALPLLLKHDAKVHAIHFSPDGSRIVTASQDKTARVWDAQTGQPLAVPMNHSGGVVSAQFSSNGKWIATASWDKTARVWDAQSGKPLTEPMEHGSFVRSVQFSPDGKRIVTISQNLRRLDTVRVWNAETGKPLSANMEISSRSVQFSSDGKRILTASGPGAQVWDAETGQPLTALLKTEGSTLSASFAPDGMTFISGGLESLQRWDAQSGQPTTSSVNLSASRSRLNHSASEWSGSAVKTVNFPSYDGKLEFSRDGSRVLTTSGENTAQTWDAQTGQPLTVPLEHNEKVVLARFSPDGERIVTGSGSTVRVWDVQTSQPLTEPLEHGGDVLSCQFSPDGRRIAIASADNAVRIWDIAPSGTRCPDWLLQMAEAISGQVLNKKRVLEPTKLDRAETITQIRQKLIQASDRDDWVVWGRWFLAEPTTRTISPFSKILSKE